jgi:single-strand DNA-binding protein
MISATVSGRITKDAQLRDAGSSKVCSFGMASNEKRKGEDVTTFVDVSIFGKQGETLCQYLTKGSFVIASGKLSTRVHNDKTYVQLDCQAIELGPRSAAGRSESRDSNSGNKPSNSYPDEDYGQTGGADDPLPF